MTLRKKSGREGGRKSSPGSGKRRTDKADMLPAQKGVKRQLNIQGLHHGPDLAEKRKESIYSLKSKGKRNVAHLEPGQRKKRKKRTRLYRNEGGSVRT